MRTRPLGPSGIEASVIGLGTWAIGGWMWGGADEAQSVRAIRAALDAGISLIDTAPVYGFGVAERVVAKAIEGRRDRVVLATKCGLVWDTDRGEHFFDSNEDAITDGPAARRVRRYLGPDSIRREVEASLARLGTDRIDLFQTHWQDPTTPIDDTMGTLLDLRRQGKIRAIGVSNATPQQMDRYRRLGPLDSDQEKYSMIDRAMDQTNLPWCQRHRTAFLSYSTLALGLLTGKITADRAFGPGDLRANNPRFTPENLRRIDAFMAELRPIAQAHRATPGQTVLAWTLAQPGVTHTLVGARTPGQAIENAAAGDLLLTSDQIAQIDRSLRSCCADIP